MSVTVSMFEATILLIAATAVAALVLLRPKTPPPAAPARLSRLCGAAFFFALLALMAGLAAILTAEYARGGPVLLSLNPREVADLRMASEILRLCALPLALAALGLAIAGRGAVREGEGALRGRALYRASCLAALAVGAYVVWLS